MPTRSTQRMPVLPLERYAELSVTMLGHASAAMTLDVYAEMFNDDLERHDVGEAGL